MTSLPRQVFGFTLTEVRLADPRGRRRPGLEPLLEGLR